MEHAFTSRIEQALDSAFGSPGKEVYEKSPLLRYLNIKTRSATLGAKSRGSFASIYAIYVLVEDYLAKGFDKRKDYSDYQGARFSDLFQRQRELPFGSKLQNHALNSRMNEEFRKYFNETEYVPILRDLDTNRYWINENLLKVKVDRKIYNIASVVIDIIDEYIAVKRGAFEKFIETCERLKTVTKEGDRTVQSFILDLLAPNVDVRIFEIVSYAILEFYYHEQTVYFGQDPESIQKENLKLYKTGRTNANDGGIDFVMRPLGRFFQVTETLDVRKYFLDIDKIEHYPISFVIKSEDTVAQLRQRLQADAERRYSITTIVDKYMNCIEEIINLTVLRQRFDQAVALGFLRNILDEIIHQSRVEFNYEQTAN